MSHNITVEGGTSVRLKTAGKYCDRDIVVTAAGTENKPPQNAKYKVALEYLESTGTQYIDTGFIPNQDTRVLTEHSYTKQPENRGFIYGAGVAATNRAFEMYTWGANWNSPYGYTNITMPISFSFLIGDKITIDKSKNRKKKPYVGLMHPTPCEQTAKNHPVEPLPLPDATINQAKAEGRTHQKLKPSVMPC